MTLEPLESWDLGKTWGTFTSGTFHGSIRGVEIQKSDDDLERYRELVEISQPDIVIETGTRRGGSALYLHHDLGLQVVTIDIAPTFDNGKVPWHANSGIRSLVGSSVKPEIISEVLPLIRGKRVMVSLDSDHHSAHVQAEMRVWGQFVSPGCYMVVEDACFDLFLRLHKMSPCCGCRARATVRLPTPPQRTFRSPAIRRSSSRRGAP